MVDTKILVYAHNQNSPFFDQARKFLADLVGRGGFSISELILFEFFLVITNGRKLESPLSSEAAWAIVSDMVETSGNCTELIYLFYYF